MEDKVSTELKYTGKLEKAKIHEHLVDMTVELF